MEYKDLIEVMLGFANNDDVWLHKELENNSAWVLVEPEVRSLKHIIVNGTDNERKLPNHRYVHCAITAHSLAMAANYGLTKDVVPTIMVYPPKEPVRLSTKDSFRHNSIRQTSEKHSISLPPDLDDVLDEVLEIGNVHVMSNPIIPFLGKTIEAKTSSYHSNVDFKNAVMEKTMSNHSVFIYSYVLQYIQEYDHFYPAWRWNYAPKA